LQDFAQSRGLPPLLIATDQEGGYVKRVREGVLETPPAMDLGKYADPQLCFSAGYYVSRDLKKLGINLFYAPVLDINNNPRNPVIGLRSFGTTLDAVLGCALPFEQGARRAAAEREGGALPVIKHFPGHGDTEKDSHWDLPVVRKNLPILRSFELMPFRAAIQQGAVAVMTAHILYPEIDPNWPATLSPRWLQEILRGELGFRGTVFTDAMEMHAIAEHFASAKPPLQALLAGADVLLFTSWQDEPRQAILELQQSLQPSHWAALRRALENQLRLKLSLIQPEHYLDKAEAEWYESFRWRSPETNQPIYSREKTQELLRGIRWSPPPKKKRVWLAGRKNRR
ncbi:MAG: glycoside hydrolase family 3 protein, partial [Turneriella sp.]|nr:glycoside hydrolase family 3 protein [Turneriella sp.]